MPHQIPAQEEPRLARAKSASIVLGGTIFGLLLNGIEGNLRIRVDVCVARISPINGVIDPDVILHRLHGGIRA